jgi:hypothetical protein
LARPALEVLLGRARAGERSSQRRRGGWPSPGRPEDRERDVMRPRLVYWLPFLLLAFALAVVVWTVVHAAVEKALAPLGGG